MSLYYEAHITIEPVFDERLKAFQECAPLYGFRVADLLMQKRSSDTAERSQYDTFATGRHQHLVALKIKMLALINWLNDNGYKVWRYKIEDTLIDSRYEDVLDCLTQGTTHDDDDQATAGRTAEAEEPGRASDAAHPVRAADLSRTDDPGESGRRSLGVY
jgi:hypothetical protein